VHAELVARGETIGENRVARLMRNQGISAVPRRRFKRTTDSEHKHPVAPNLLERNFTADARDKVWAGDITYVWTTEGWAYLAVLIDLYSRKVVGWALGKTLSRDLAIRALRMALITRRPPPGLIHHTDRGSQYASREYRHILATNGVRQSMSRAGNCWDNAVSESFFATLKKELVHGELYATRTEAYDSVAEYIDNYYNARRRHSAIDYQIPNVLETRYARLAA
jgi:transposase InsO family protein